MRIAYFGAKMVGDVCLAGLLESDHTPRLVVAYQNQLSQDLLTQVEERGGAVRALLDLNSAVGDLEREIASAEIDILLSVGFPSILPASLLRAVAYPINVHTAALPKYRGFHPLSAAFLADDPLQGTTVHFMSPDVDAGAILLQAVTQVSNEDDMCTVRDRLCALSADLAVKAVEQIESGTFYARPPVGIPSDAPRRTPQDSKMPFDMTSRAVHNFVRALVDPYPNAFAKCGTETVRIKRSVGSNTPGLVLARTLDGLHVISTADGVVLLELDRDLAVGDLLE